MELNQQQINALGRLGLTAEQIDQFPCGVPLVFLIPAAHQPTIALVQWTARRLRAGIISINDPGRGIAILASFRGQSFSLARLLGCAEVELFGAAVINPRLADLLERQGFEQREVDCPDEIGNETMEIGSRVYRI